MSKGIKKLAIKGFLWSAVERFSRQGLLVLIELILIRLLTPEDYGIIGMIAVFIAVSQVFVDGGLVLALINKNKCDEVDYATVFITNIGIALFFYILLFFAAPYISLFYDQPILTKITRIVSTTLLINAISAVPRALFAIDIDYKTPAKISVISVLISGGVAIIMAYSGYSLWALVVQRILMISLKTILLYVYSHWMPKLRLFSWDRFKQLFSYGSRILASGLLNSLFTNAYGLLIGRFFSPAILGYYSKSNQFVSLPSVHFGAVLHRVSFTVLSKIKHDRDKFMLAYRNIAMLSTVLTMPILMGMAVMSKHLIIIMFTETWEGMIPVFQLLSISMILQPLLAININVINAAGRADMSLRLEIIGRMIEMIILAATISFGIRALLWGKIAAAGITALVNFYYVKNALHYTFRQQIRDYFPVIISTSLTVFIMYLIAYHLNTGLLVQFCVAMVAGIIFYLGIVFFFNIGNVRETKKMLYQLRS